MLERVYLTLPTYRRFLAPLQQTTFENIVTKEENEQFLLLPQRFQLFSVIIPTFIELFFVFAKMISKSSDAELLYEGKGYEMFGFILNQPIWYTLVS